MSSERQTRKRLATRRAISQAADRLFLERGFENVTVDEIAAAADVGRMTVFNHFPRKEDMFFDRDEEAREVLRDALRQRDPNVSPVETLRLLAHRLVAEQVPYLEFSHRSQNFVATVERSEILKARARAIRDEVTQLVASEMSGAVTGGSSCPAEKGITGVEIDTNIQLAAGMLIAAWSAALIQAHRTFRQTQDSAAASAVFLRMTDLGSAGVVAMQMHGKLATTIN